jgi:hypothetical protein
MILPFILPLYVSPDGRAPDGANPNVGAFGRASCWPRRAKANENEIELGASAGLARLLSLLLLLVAFNDLRRPIVHTGRGQPACSSQH